MSPPEPPAFDLRTEPWIPCLRADGRVEEFSLCSLFEHAANLVEFACETPTVSVAVLRLLLAILHRSLAGPTSPGQWAAWWASPGLPSERITDYLAGQADSFDLFHPTRPFFQSAGITGREKRTVAKLIGVRASGNNVPLFGYAMDAEPPPLTPAAAARWLLHVQAYDPGGMKTGVGRGPGHAEQGLLGGFAHVRLVGACLRDTLLLNLVRYDPGTGQALAGEYGKGPDLPVWERPSPPPQPPDPRIPTGYLDLLTWPARRVRLFPEPSPAGMVVMEAGLLSGDRLVKEWDLRLREPFAAWSQPEAKGSRTPGWDALKVQPERAAWRGVQGLIAHAKAENQSPRQHPPDLLAQWLPTLIGDGVLAPDEVPSIEVSGFRYAEKGGGTFAYSHAEIIPLPLRILTEEGFAAYSLLIEAVQTAEQAGIAVGKLGRGMHEAAGGVAGGQPRRRSAADDAGERAQRWYWAVLDQPFRELVLDAGHWDESASLERLRHRWLGTLRRAAEAAADQAIASAGPGSLRRRTFRDRNGRELPVPNAAEVELRFRGDLRRILGPRQRSKTEVNPA